MFPRLMAVVICLTFCSAASAHAAPITFFSFSLTQRFTSEDEQGKAYDVLT